MPTIALEASGLKVLIDQARGGEITSIARHGGTNALFHEPWSTPAPADGGLSYGSGVLDWLSRYRGGWQVMFPNAGAECVVDGVEHPLHGEVCATPADVVKADPHQLALRSTTGSGLRLDRRLFLHPERSVLRIEERVVNGGDRPFRYAWGHHPAFAATPGTWIDLPVGPLSVDATFEDPAADLMAGAIGTWPTIPGRGGRSVRLDRIPEPPVERVLYLPDRPAGWAALREPGAGTGLGLAWDIEAFPHLWLWEQLGGERFPFQGRARIVALEPVSAWPGDGLAAAIQRGRARTLAPGASATAWLTLTLFAATDDRVVGVSRDGTVSTTPAIADGTAPVHA